MAPKSKKHNNFTRIIFYPFRQLLKSINEVMYVKMEYRYVTGHKLDLINPTRYTEKLQYLRLYTYPKDNEVSRCASRIGLKEYIKEIALEDHLIKTYGIYDKYDDIPFTKLPSSFVIKCNHASGFNEIIYDKNLVNHKELRKKFNKWQKIDYGKKTVERHYSKINRKLIVEELLLENNKLPIEYKIHVFNGQAKYMYIVTNRGNDIAYNNYLIDWTPFDGANFNHWPKAKEEIKKPTCWNEAIKIAERLASPFPFVRVDLYIINNKIYISEMTFTPAKGTLIFEDDNVDYTIGEWLSIQK